MSEALLVTREDVREFWAITKNMNVDRINPYILRAQQRDLKPFLGDALYFDMIEHLTDQKYVDLLNGVAYETNGHTIYFGGVKPLLCAYAYATLINENPIHITRAGNKNKKDDNSTEIAGNTIGVKSNEADSEGLRLQEETRRFLNDKKSDYPLFEKGSYGNTPKRTTLSLTKVPRSVQK